MSSDCLGCNDGVWHEHDGECFNCGADCNQAQQADLSDDLGSPEIVFVCDRCSNRGATRGRGGEADG